MRSSLIGITILSSLCACSAQAQTPTIGTVVNAASQVSGTIAPGMVAIINGSNLGNPIFKSCANPYPVPFTCDGMSVLVNGKSAPVVNAGSSQLTFQVPFSTSGSSASIQVSSATSGLKSTVVNVAVAAVAPGLYSANGTGAGLGYYFVAGGLVNKISSAVQMGDTVTLYGTGFGATNPVVADGNVTNTLSLVVAPVTLTIGGKTAVVQSASLQTADSPANGAPGANQVVFTVPQGFTIPAGQTEATFPMVLTVGGVATQTVNLRVATPPPSITSVDPSPVPLSASPQTITFNGGGFQTGATVKVSNPQNNVFSLATTFVSSSQLTAQITVGTTAGTWSALVSNVDGGQSPIFQFVVSGSGPVPLITSIVTTSSAAPQIAQNTWIEIHGSNLAKVITDWTNSDFTNGLPMTLGGVTATVNGKSAAIFYVSPTQVNVLAPLDGAAAGTVPVQLNTPYGLTAIKTVTELSTSPAFFVLDGTHVAARHYPDYSLVGPASLSIPGYVFTPAKPGDIVLLYATGFGQTAPPISDQLKGLGALPTLPTVTLGGAPVSVSFAGLSAAGLYQFTVTVPSVTLDGEMPLTASFNGSPTQNNVVLTVLH